jgi:hypothetical protein
MSSATKLFKIRIQTTLPRTASRKDASCPPKVTAGKALAHERCCWRRNAGLVRETQRNVPRQSCPAYCAEHLCRGPCLRYRDNFASAQQRRAWPRQAEVLSRSGARGYSGAFLSSDKKTSGVVCCDKRYFKNIGRPNTPSGENDDFVVRLSAPEGDI